jgi:hypothetical protein
MAWPIEVPQQGLYEASNTQKHPLGDVAKFEVDLGDGVNRMVLARYMMNGNATSIAVGQAVGFAGNATAIGQVDTAALNNASGYGVVAGVNCASLLGTNTSNGSTGYCWVAFQGPVTCASLNASVNSNGVSVVTANSLGVMVATGSTVAQSAAATAARLMGQAGFTVSTQTRSKAPVAGAFVNLFMK